LKYYSFGTIQHIKNETNFCCRGRRYNCTKGGVKHSQRWQNDANEDEGFFPSNIAKIANS